MTGEMKQEFTRRLTVSNRTGVILIMYEIIFAHMEDAKKALEEGNREEFKASIRHAQEMIRELGRVLNFHYELSKNLYTLYNYCNRQLSTALYQAKAEGILEAEKVLEKLYASFVEIAKTDGSAPMMGNVQQVYAGMTYGKNNQVENYIEVDRQRGFLA